MSLTSKSTGLSPSPSLEQARDEFATRLASSVDLAIFDLDQTLVRSSGVHLQLLLRTVAACGGDADSPLLPQRYDTLRGQSYTVILREMRAQAFRDSQEVGEAVFNDRFDRIVNGFRAADYPGVQIEVIPGADRLLEHLDRLRIERLHCTGSPRTVARMLLRESGLSRLVSDERLVCCGDTTLNKEDQAYWDTVLGERDRSRVIGFEDHPHGTAWLHRLARVAITYVRPSVALEQFEALRSRDGARIVTVKEWGDLLPAE